MHNLNRIIPLKLKLIFQTGQQRLHKLYKCFIEKLRCKKTESFKRTRFWLFTLHYSHLIYYYLLDCTFYHLKINVRRDVLLFQRINIV